MSTVTVHIIEESQYPPVISPLEVEVFSYQDDFPGSIVGRIVASDQDPHDVLGYEISSTANQYYADNEDAFDMKLWFD